MTTMGTRESSRSVGSAAMSFEEALAALHSFVGDEVVVSIAGAVGAPDHGLVTGGVLRRGTEVAEEDRHFVGDAVLFQIEGDQGKAAAYFSIDEEALHGEESLASPGWVQLRLGSLDLTVLRGTLDEWKKHSYGA